MKAMDKLITAIETLACICVSCLILGVIALIIPGMPNIWFWSLAVIVFVFTLVGFILLKELVTRPENNFRKGGKRN
jgi:type III secretory pathway component EscV